MPRATVVESTAGLGQTLRAGRLGCARIPWHTGCQEDFRPRVYATPRPMQAWSLALGVGQLLVTRTPVREAAKTRPEALQHNQIHQQRDVMGCVVQAPPGGGEHVALRGFFSPCSQTVSLCGNGEVCIER